MPPLTHDEGLQCRPTASKASRAHEYCSKLHKDPGATDDHIPNGINNRWPMDYQELVNLNEINGHLQKVDKQLVELDKIYPLHLVMVAVKVGQIMYPIHLVVVAVREIVYVYQETTVRGYRVLYSWVHASFGSAANPELTNNASTAGLDTDDQPKCCNILLVHGKLYRWRSERSAESTNMDNSQHRLEGRLTT